MNLVDIAASVRQQSGKANWSIPLPDPAKQWVRFECPYCQPGQRKRTGRKNNPLTAAINYDALWFECFVSEASA
jgi:hypothetical protein